MSETDLAPTDGATELDNVADQLDEDDRLKPEFVRAVLDAVEAGDNDAAHALVEPLHPADIAAIQRQDQCFGGVGHHFAP